MDEPKYNATAMPAVTRIDSRMAVILYYGRVSATLSIAEARELANDLTRAATDAESKLKN